MQGRGPRQKRSKARQLGKTRISGSGGGGPEWSGGLRAELADGVAQ